MIIKTKPDNQIEKFLEVEFGKFDKKLGINDDYEEFVFEDREDDEIRGVVYGWACYGQVYIDRILVLPQFRGRGVGRKLLKKVEEEFEGDRYDNINLYTNRAQAPEFYEKCGFSLENIRYSFIDSKYDKFIYVKPLWHLLEPENFDIYKKFYEKQNNYMTDLAFSCRLAWNTLYNIRWTIFEDCLLQVSFENKFSSPFMLMPLGEFDKEKLYRIVKFVKHEFDERGKNLVIDCIDDEHIDIFRQLDMSFSQPVFDNIYSDYLYDAEKLRTLAGRHYSKKRNHLHNFERLYPNYTYESLSPKHFDECRKLLLKWEEEKGVDDNDVNESEREPIENVFDNWEKLDMRGGVILIDGQVQAFSIGASYGDTAFIHFEKANDEYSGIYVAINKYTLMYEFPDVRFVNREEDLGIPGLRRAKESYYPIKMIKKWKTLKNIS